MAVIILLFYVSRAGTREVHNKLEKNRSVVIKIFFTLTTPYSYFYLVLFLFLFLIFLWKAFYSPKVTALPQSIQNHKQQLV